MIEIQKQGEVTILTFQGELVLGVAGGEEELINLIKEGSAARRREFDRSVGDCEDMYQKHYLTAQEAASRLGVSLQAVHAALRKKKLTGYRHGAVWLVEPDSVASYRPRNYK